MTAALRPETVTWAYRLLLGREPESEAAVAGWTAAAPADLREGILGSPEFAGLVGEGLPLRIPLRGDPGEAAHAILTLLEEREPDAAAVQALAAAKPGLGALRRHLLSHPTLRDRIAPRLGPKRHAVTLGDAAFEILADAMEPELKPVPARVHRLAHLTRAALPDGGAGAVLADGAAGIGLTPLAMAGAAPGYAKLLAWEADLPRAAHLAANLAAHAKGRSTVVADAMPPLAALGLPRLDLLRLRDADRVLAEAEALRGLGTLVAAVLDLRAELAPHRPHPAATLRAWRDAHGGLAVFDRQGVPVVAAGDAEVSLALEAALESPERLVEVVLGDTAWVARYFG
jgi:hypothetical protein